MCVYIYYILNLCICLLIYLFICCGVPRSFPLISVKITSVNSVV